MLRHRTASKNLQSDFTGDRLIGFTFPGGTSPHGTGSFYASRDHFPTPSQLHRAQTIAARRWVCTPKPSRERAKDPRLLSLPVTLLTSPGSRRDDWAVLVGLSGSQWMLQRQPHHVHGVRTAALHVLLTLQQHFQEISKFSREENWAGQTLISHVLIKI